MSPKSGYFIDLTAFAVQFRYEACELVDVPMDRTTILEQVTELFRRVENNLR